MAVSLPNGRRPQNSKDPIRNRENTDELRPQKKGGLSPPCLRNGADEPYFFISSFFVSPPFSILTSMM